MSIPKIKEVKDALEQMKNDLVLVNDQILVRETGNPISTIKSKDEPHKRLIFNDIRFSYHRVVYWLYSGVWPDYVVHIDGDNNNYHPSNLRAATLSQCKGNASPISNSLTGLKGVRYLPEKKRKQYRATIMFQGKAKHIGYFDTAEEACYAYDVFSKVCFGEFANLHNEERFYQRVGNKLEEIKEAFKQ